jgi:hypothetical protein
MMPFNIQASDLPVALSQGRRDSNLEPVTQAMWQAAFYAARERSDVSAQIEGTDAQAPWAQSGDAGLPTVVRCLPPDCPTPALEARSDLTSAGTPRPALRSDGGGHPTAPVNTAQFEAEGLAAPTAMRDAPQTIGADEVVAKQPERDVSPVGHPLPRSRLTTPSNLAKIEPKDHALPAAFARDATQTIGASEEALVEQLDRDAPTVGDSIAPPTVGWTARVDGPMAPIALGTRSPVSALSRPAAFAAGTVAGHREAAVAEHETVDEAPTTAYVADADPSPPADESVLVFHDGQGLQVVVRNARLAPQTAVWCAMETAYQIVGNRKALLHVTLNGRTVYEGAPMRPAGARPSPVVVFSC